MIFVEQVQLRTFSGCVPGGRCDKKGAPYRGRGAVQVMAQRRRRGGGGVRDGVGSGRQVRGAHSPLITLLTAAPRRTASQVRLRRHTAKCTLPLSDDVYLNHKTEPNSAFQTTEMLVTFRVKGVDFCENVDPGRYHVHNFPLSGTIAGTPVDSS